MIYIYRDRILYLNQKKYLLEWCEGEPYIQNLETGEKTFVEMHSVSKFSWVKNKIKYTLKINRETKRPSKDKVWKSTGFKKPGFEEVWECDCTVSTKKII